MDPRLRTRYMGLELRSPLVASSSPLTGSVDDLLALEAAGAGAVVLPSLFEERVDEGAGRLELPPAYATLVAEAKEALEIPVVASLNGHTAGGWLGLAELLQQAGADAVELNVYSVESDRYTSGAAVEERTLRIVHRVKTAVTIPVAVKLSPYYTSLAHLAGRLAEARADALVLFNRFVRPDVDVDTLTLTSGVRLSHPDDLRLALQWLAILRGRVQVSLAGGGGVRDHEDVVKLLLAGADVVTVASALLERGPGALEELTTGLCGWLDEHGFAGLDRVRGVLDHEALPDPGGWERALYVQALEQGAR